MLAEYAKKLPAFDTNRSTPRSRRKLPRAANDAALTQAWRDMVDDMVLTEVIRRENVARLAKEKGKPDPNANETPVAEKLKARFRRLRNEVKEADTEDMVAMLLNAVARSYDPHSDYMGAREEQRFKDAIKASIRDGLTVAADANRFYGEYRLVKYAYFLQRNYLTEHKRKRDILGTWMSRMASSNGAVTIQTDVRPSMDFAPLRYSD
jgi:hypothetical protein